MSAKFSFRKVLYIMGILAFAGSLFGCTNRNNTQKPGTDTKVENTVEASEEIASFYLERTGYDVFEKYDVKKEDGSDAQKILKELAKVCAKYDVSSWDGFDESQDMLDGEGFSLKIEYAGGKVINARGDNAFPADYFDFVNAVREVFAPLENAKKDEERQAAIEKGINGKVTSVMFTFVQRGTSGHDSYEIVVGDRDELRFNFDVQVDSKSGEFFPEGEYKKVTSVSNDVIGLDKLQQMIEKYDLIQWYGYEETAADPDNEEYFFAEISFDDGLVIDACGTKHPKNYDKFRKEFLTWLKETADAVDAVTE